MLGSGTHWCTPGICRARCMLARGGGLIHIPRAGRGRLLPTAAPADFTQVQLDLTCWPVTRLLWRAAVSPDLSSLGLQGQLESRVKALAANEAVLRQQLAKVQAALQAAEALAAERQQQLEALRAELEAARKKAGGEYEMDRSITWQLGGHWFSHADVLCRGSRG